MSYVTISFQTLYTTPEFTRGVSPDEWSPVLVFFPPRRGVPSHSGVRPDPGPYVGWTRSDPRIRGGSGP